MQLLNIRIDGAYKGLKDREFDFSYASENILAFVGLNGTGKSQLLELIAEIFSYLHREQRSDFRVRSSLGFAVRVRYRILGYGSPRLLEEYEVDIDDNGDVTCNVVIDGEFRDINFYSITMPSFIVGYSSGLNENLQRAFLKNAVQFYDVMSVRHRRRSEFSRYTDVEQLLKINEKYLRRYPGVFSDGTHADDYLTVEQHLQERDTQLPSSIFLDYDTNSLLAASLAVVTRDVLTGVYGDLKFKYPHRVVIKYDLRGFPFENDAITDIKELIDIAGDGNFNPLSMRTPDEFYDQFEIDYLCGEITLNLSDADGRARVFSRYRGMPYLLFSKLYKVYLLGVRFWRGNDKYSLRRDDFFGTIKKPIKSKNAIEIVEFKLSDGEDSIDYDDLSDGEAQLFTVLAAPLVFSDDNVLFIYDEPETHLNPNWRTGFHKKLSLSMKKVGDNVDARQVFLSTHSPFILSSLKRENVFKFEKVDGIVQMLPSPVQTYGSSFDVLAKQFYGMKSLVSETAIDDILLHIHQVDASNSSKREWVEQNVGDSMEKAYLLKRLGE